MEVISKCPSDFGAQVLPGRPVRASQTLSLAFPPSLVCHGPHDSQCEYLFILHFSRDLINISFEQEVPVVLGSGETICQEG